MSGNFFGGLFFSEGFFGASSSGAFDPVLFRGRRKHRCILPDGSICYATKTEMRAILTKLASEYKDVERNIVPTIKRERKKIREFSLAEEVEFKVPMIQVSRTLEIPQIQVDAEAMIRAYIEGVSSRKRRKDEEEWLLMIVH